MKKPHSTFSQRDKILKGLELAYEKLIEFKKIQEQQNGGCPRRQNRFLGSGRLSLTFSQGCQNRGGGAIG